MNLAEAPGGLGITGCGLRAAACGLAPGRAGLSAAPPVVTCGGTAPLASALCRKAVWGETGASSTVDTSEAAMTY